MEESTLKSMIALYCKKHHNGALCPECQALYDYALERNKRCPRKEEKTFCSSCPIHCYRPEMRLRIRAVMKFSGPRMLFYSPKLALSHIKDTLTRKIRKK